MCLDLTKFNCYLIIITLFFYCGFTQLLVMLYKLLRLLIRILNYQHNRKCQCQVYILNSVYVNNKLSRSIGHSTALNVLKINLFFHQ